MLSKKIRDLRNEKNFSQQDLATKLNLARYNVANWEQERSEPSIADLKKLADVFGVSIDYLVGREDDFGNVNVVSNLGLSVHEEDMIRKLRTLGPLQFKYIQSQINALYDVEKESIKK